MINNKRETIHAEIKRIGIQVIYHIKYMVNNKRLIKFD